ncbi:MAG TPA: 3-deoxy-manno-octulosonate cytidylyltransferase [Thermoanaerobaculaceae bacterium]|nr:3-deoxy-manno-octulosonate cytidylyltransferase [Thermoanaerobaculaceae bacterium]
MDRNRVLAVIPARYSSTRFPGKPLATIAGRPMVAHVVERAREAGCFDEVLVATDDERIARAAAEAGARAVMTGACSSGTDRVALAVRDEPAGVVLNVQGDEPALPPSNLRRLAEFLAAHRDVAMATLALPGTAGDLDNPNVVKVVCDLRGRALYFSRAPIPYPRNPGAAPVRRHVGLYGFQKDALLAFTSWPEAEIERAEGLEQLRALAHGMAVQVLDTEEDSIAVDVPADVPRAELALAALARQRPGIRGQGSGGGR